MCGNEADTLVNRIMDALPLEGFDDDVLQAFIKDNYLHGRVNKYQLMCSVLTVVEASLMFGHAKGTEGFPRLPLGTYYEKTDVNGFMVTVRVFLEEDSTDVLIVEVIPHQYDVPMTGQECQVARFHVCWDLPGFVFPKETDPCP